MAVYEEYSAEHDSLPPLVTDEQTGEEVKFDCICLGTGLKECVVSGLLSRSKRKVSLSSQSVYESIGIIFFTRLLLPLFRSCILTKTIFTVETPPLLR